MKHSHFDDFDEWEEQDFTAKAKSHKTQRDKARARRRIDEYEEKKQLQAYLNEVQD
ncbi:PA3496 family putative envelope integrity protein [Agarivorans gilvus]|uniref:Uncharacterized protein n=1 Tax=Agarivorans gilvus TaxID=680279 RepID=A0ABQ1I439_9ALTE|nr:hypothetical protein [Agarivorans gilvus]GGB08162.1 hypothetical protein GCM10007414_21960 [Agarivorans gilvus]